MNVHASRTILFLDPRMIAVTSLGIAFGSFWTTKNSITRKRLKERITRTNSISDPNNECMLGHKIVRC
jgi:hypothetical protein